MKEYRAVVTTNSGTYAPSVFKVMEMPKVFTEGTYNVMCTCIGLILLQTYMRTCLHTYVHTHIHTYYNWPNIVAGENELPCGGHRTHNYRSTDRVKRIVSQSLHAYYHCLFHSCEIIHRYKVSCVRHYWSYPCSISITTPVCLSLAFTKACIQFSLWTQLGQAARPLPLSKHKDISSAEVWPKVLEDVVEYRGLERRYDHNPLLGIGRIPPRDKHCQT
jgi:hypothetical protein